jgi:SAM-dependent methyltransferase
MLNLARGWHYLTTRGVAYLFQESLYRAINSLCEFSFGVETAGRVSLREVGLAREDWHEYAPMGYWAIFSALLKVPLPINRMSVLDFGSGKGRPLIVAGAMGIEQAIGVDIVPAFNEIARRNVAGMRGLKAQIIEHDAATYRVPDHVNLIYLANSFSGETLASMLENIRTSHFRYPRELYMLCFNTRIFDTHVCGLKWIRKIRAGHYYPDFTCGIYRIGG